MKVQRISKNDVRVKTGKAVGPDDIPVDVRRCLAQRAVNFEPDCLTSF